MLTNLKSKVLSILSQARIQNILLQIESKNHINHYQSFVLKDILDTKLNCNFKLLIRSV